MSTTVGVGIEVDSSGFNTAGTLFAWNATYGYFLSWGLLTGPLNIWETRSRKPGKKLCWSFIEKSVSTLEPVIVTVSAMDPADGSVLCNSTIILEWEGDYAVVVRNPR